MITRKMSLLSIKN